jgi:hypothetical protein
VNPAAAIFEALAVSGAESARLVGEDRSAWHHYRVGNTSASSKKVQAWLDHLASQGMPLELKWTADGCSAAVVAGRVVALPAGVRFFRRFPSGLYEIETGGESTEDEGQQAYRFRLLPDGEWKGTYEPAEKLQRWYAEWAEHEPRLDGACS